MTDLSPLDWTLLALGALIVGFSKTGIAGIGALAVAVFANVLPARESTGVVLPMLILADFVAVGTLHRHAVWTHLWRLFPFAALGIVAGWLAMKHLDAAEIRVGIGGVLLAMVALHLRRQRREKEAAERPSPAHSLRDAAGMGLLAGFTTMLANAAGPIMVLYLLAMRLPKLEFMGTGAWYFCILNLFKVPFSWNLGLINPMTLKINLYLAPVILLGAFGGRALLPRIPQKIFERLALVLTAIAALRLLV
ncbi:MAG: sulfite exporter TauE/SafE family protein [Verrucomicrobiae bacterium]|nr:sulfite exporter TauE/SafE family protein [Verrucomicrobiae bacterium]